MKRNNLKSIVTSCLAATFAVTCFAGLAIASGKTIEEDKAVVIRPTTPAQKEFKVDIKPGKEMYKLGDKITFQVKGNETFYLWLFGVNDKDKRARMLVPGLLQQGNKYEGGKEYTLPMGSSYELIADKVGVEKVVMVASNKWITNFDKKQFSKGDNYYETTPQKLDKYMKGLRVINTAPQTDKKKIVVKELNLLVTGDASPAQATAQTSGDNAVVFISQSSAEYQVGDIVRVVYGSNKPGWVSVYLQYPDGRVDSLLTQEVDGKTIYTFKAKATAPIGPQYLMAVFSVEKDNDVQAAQVPQFTDYIYHGKGLQLIPEEPPVYHLSSFTIK